ncbi:hypothetical protein I350_06705 [Cryptococcus amylolentus CBS 6273]|uniref:Uncharacterized protein n=1 Tax=Cryptococcus amylolentus CBS 6273 TaxID=1296118 RepID=A0A1E3JGU6_9TREE|nr:hypothetical protein I350_06705 [Cryptococcus amylolentus CBS 6273]
MASFRRLSLRPAGDDAVIPSTPPLLEKKRRHSSFFAKAAASSPKSHPSPKPDTPPATRHQIIAPSPKTARSSPRTAVKTPEHDLCYDVVRQVIAHFAKDSTLAEHTVLLLLNKEIRSIYLSFTYQRLSLDPTFCRQFFCPLFRAFKLDSILLFAHTGNTLGRLTPSDVPLVYPYPPAPTTSQTALSKLKARWSSLIVVFVPTPTQQELSTRRLGGRYRCLLMNTEVLVVHDVMSLKCLAAFLLAVLQDLLAIDLQEHVPLSPEFRLLPAIRWVVYAADFAADIDITRPTFPAECALYLASRCLFSPHRCVHSSPGGNNIFASKDLLLFPATRKRFVPTVKHLVLHNVLPREVKHCYVVPHIEMYLSRLQDAWWEEGGVYGRTKWDNREEAEVAWHEVSIKDWLVRFFCGGAEGFELEGPMKRYLPAVELIEFNNTNADIQKVTQNTYEYLYSKGMEENMLAWKGVIKASKPGSKCCEGCGKAA